MTEVLACPICNKNYKGKIGVGVHLKRSHTSEERGKLWLSQLTELTPLIMVVVTIMAIGAYLVGVRDKCNV